MHRKWLCGMLSGGLSLVVATGTVAASPGGPSVGRATGAQGGLGAAIVGGLVTLVVGGFLVWGARSYTSTVTDMARSESGRSFLVGFVAFLGILGLIFLGLATGILLLVAIPVAFVYALLCIVGSMIGLLAIGRSLAESWVSALLVAVVVSLFVSGVPFLGGLVGFVVTTVGTGAVINHARDDSNTRYPGSYPQQVNKRNW
ncbi:hypothetical protein Halru_2540 [Halovivax ruber XH-70]|uniref:DUF8173 domain-containing protein n=1 Tax=Halovivax ruber (strain DSM 18193 / JCM 13892 / XH-70) TaxID=797302 RepID=L0IFW2_HALRX|nr:hypothetical protein [Halovivax ruber]AGB17121.1 hypothetical protein Halru_2540 [Halovivax ruber XH-70]